MDFLNYSDVLLLPVTHNRRNYGRDNPGSLRMD